MNVPSPRIFNRLRRHVCLAAAVFLILPTFAFAQQVGVKAGVNFASLTPEEDEDPDTSRHRGLVGGVWFRKASNTRVSFQVEGLFSEKGVTFDRLLIDEQGTVGPADVRVRYIEIPLLARADFGAPGSSTRVFVVGGAAPAFKLSSRVKFEFEGQERIVDTSDDIKPLDIGLAGGLGVEFRRALVEVRYTHGLRHINEDDNDPDDSIKNRVLSVTVGFRVF